MAPGAAALAAGAVLLFTPVYAATPEFTPGPASVSMKVEARPDLASQALANAVSVNAVEEQSGVSMKVSKPPVQPAPSGVSMKVSRPSGTLPEAQPEQNGVSMKVSPRPPAARPPAPVEPPQETPAPPEEPVAAAPEQPVTPPPVAQKEKTPPAEQPIAMPNIKIGAEDVGAEPESEEEGVDVATALENYRYVRGAKLNPFRPLTDKPEKAPEPAIVDTPDEGPQVAVKRPPIRQPRPIQTPIEKYPLNSLDLVAIMRMKREALALVQIPDGAKGFIIRKGTYIGNEGGTVSEIDLQNNKVVVDVEEEDMFGNIIINKRQLSLQKSAGDF
ncbi:Tfp pilus assembly protein PilP [Desulfatibacillum alkenivorans DSM 16219]|jgi:Tfp pilus assembly protein PilP|uniref:Tfp pilus assembly protein PilP n=1 Tax=Desulfatibacillum alkenivorans DSM 16219 TaxID=1121393 RepID=A0A1M6TTL7_9BACT|nr:pilus assembly protein PilP [Desulfatibacillum alkenivorans]SHK60281.1 Tfp pilus assembly protein PilP [Desulfatibacillum alkenivorans DSM 16219]